MKESIKIATDFAKKVGKIKGVLQVVLFGSVARGEEKADSDIDIAIIHKLENDEDLRTTVNKIVNSKIQTVYVNVDRLSNESELLSALTGEGLLLYGKPFKVSLNRKELKPYVLIVYDTTELDKKKRMLLNRALHGSVSVSRHGSKEYQTDKKGLISSLGIEKLTKACLLTEPRKAVIIKGALRRFHVKFKEILIWK